MKRTLLLLPLLLLLSVPLLGVYEVAGVIKETRMELARGAVYLKPGAKVIVTEDLGETLRILYRNVEGTIATKDTKRNIKTAAEITTPKGAVKKGETKTPDQPKTTYGKAVQKARDAAAAHETNLVRNDP